MEQQFLSLSKAEKHIGKSRSTLRRFVEGITKPESHPDRHFIKPTPDEVAELHKNNHPFSWKISAELLEREFKQEGTAKSKAANSSDQSSAIDLLQQTIGMLKTELDEKNRQIAQFQARDQETNVLLQQTTEKLAMLTQGKNQQFSDAESVVTVDSEEGSTQDVKASKEKKSFWQKLNRPLFTGK